MRTSAILFPALLPLLPLSAAETLEEEITHTVFFTLKHENGSEAEAEFREKTMKLAEIPGVEDFRWLVEVSPKNDFDYGLTMEFDDQAAYDAYNEHPDHVAYVENVWIPNVADFMEIDFREPDDEEDDD